ncbi:hypothetical protein ERHA55_27920 [Erwinia rhapontici]|nr:LLM class flavin-dependent oxidoreductase [Erwinia rhapontici]BCQ45265.1 hypothetical protein ERHA55_27920 [Erwinia rhapontici]
MEIYWYLTAPDGPQPWTASGSRKIDYAWFQEVAQAVDNLGFTGALLATGAHDPWIVGASLIPLTQRMKFLIAIQPGLVSPTLLAKMAVTFNQFSQGRVLLNVVSGDKNTLGAYGLHLEHDQRYQLSDEFLTVLKPLLAEQTVDFEGEHLHISNARLALATVATHRLRCGSAVHRRQHRTLRQNILIPISPGVKRRRRPQRKLPP